MVILIYYNRGVVLVILIYLCSSYDICFLFILVIQPSVIPLWKLLCTFFIYFVSTQRLNSSNIKTKKDSNVWDPHLHLLLQNIGRQNLNKKSTQLHWVTIGRQCLDHSFGPISWWRLWLYSSFYKQVTKAIENS